MHWDQLIPSANWTWACASMCLVRRCDSCKGEGSVSRALVTRRCRGWWECVVWIQSYRLHTPRNSFLWSNGSKENINTSTSFGRTLMCVCFVGELSTLCLLSSSSFAFLYHMIVVLICCLRWYEIKKALPASDFGVPKFGVFRGHFLPGLEQHRAYFVQYSSF